MRTDTHPFGTDLLGCDHGVGRSFLRSRAQEIEDICSEGWLRERFPDKDWHRHPRTDGRTDLCDGTPSDCTSKVRLP